jgi:hypothetical protein
MVYTGLSLSKNKNDTFNFALLISVEDQAYYRDSQQARLYILSTQGLLGDPSYIFVVWDLPHNVRLNFDSNSTKFSFLIIILMFHNRVSYSDATIKFLASLEAPCALFFSRPPTQTKIEATICS